MTQTSNGDLAAQLAALAGKIDELKNIVVGEDGDGGMRRDLKHMLSLRDKGLGVLLVLGLIITVAGQGVKDWIVHLFQGAPK